MSKNTQTAAIVATLSAITTIEAAKPAQLPLGKEFIEFSHKGKAFKLDKAVLVGNRVKSLMHVNAWVKLAGYDKLDDAAKKIKIRDEFNKQIKPAFHAYIDLAIATAGEKAGLGRFERKNGDVTTTVKYIRRAIKLEKNPAATAIANGVAKAELQSKIAARRQANKKNSVRVGKVASGVPGFRNTPRLIESRNAPATPTAPAIPEKVESAK